MSLIFLKHNNFFFNFLIHIQRRSFFVYLSHQQFLLLFLFCKLFFTFDINFFIRVCFVIDHCQVFHPKKKDSVFIGNQSRTQNIILYQHDHEKTSMYQQRAILRLFFFIIFHTQYLHKICIFLLFLFLFLYINTLRKKKKCTIIFLSFFVLFSSSTHNKKKSLRRKCTDVLLAQRIKYKCTPFYFVFVWNE